MRMLLSGLNDGGTGAGRSWCRRGSCAGKGPGAVGRRRRRGGDLLGPEGVDEFARFGFAAEGGEYFRKGRLDGVAGGECSRIGRLNDDLVARRGVYLTPNVRARSALFRLKAVIKKRTDLGRDRSTNGGRITFEFGTWGRVVRVT